jgi:hypothetical protein
MLHTIPALIVYIPLSIGVLTIAIAKFDVLGHYYFNSANTPTFNLTAINKISFMAKTFAVAAPMTANKGPAGTGAVPWLYLINKTGYISVGISQVYYVKTAGGNQQVNCTVADVISI